MSPGRFAVIAAAVVAVVIAIGVSSSGGGDDDGGGGSSQKAPSGAIVVDFAYSPEKEPLVVPLVKAFNARAEKHEGAPVFVRAQIVSSGEAQRKLAAKRLPITLWSPASSLWGRLLNFEADANYVPDENPSLVRTPLRDRDVGAAGARAGLAGQADRLRADPRAGARQARLGGVRQAEFGQFKLGHTNPDFSTSGLSAVAAEYYAATGKREGLTEADVERPEGPRRDPGRSSARSSTTATRRCSSPTR